MQTRRKFIASTSLMAIGATAKASNHMAPSSQLVHHVFFWLKNPHSKDDLQKLIAGLNTLSKIETVKKLHIGIPADTEKRDVVDNSYSVSELIFFDNLADQKNYQDHPIHKKFIETCSSLWSKVVVYDSASI